jgi:hypothetical protein
MSSCSFITPNHKVNVEGQVQAHWIKQGEPAPFNGILLNDYTFYKIMEKAQRECKQ